MRAAAAAPVAAKKRDLERALAMGVIAEARARGMKMVLTPSTAQAIQAEGLWDPDVMIIQDVVKGTGE